jgi:ACS family glucarate transporter-like MFS transporter/ACS family D-galactonate transporter-like MFS transporter
MPETDLQNRSRARFRILALIFLITTVNFADRATLSITGPSMQKEFGFDVIRMGYIFSAFSWAYVFSQVPGGWLIDRFGARRVYSVSIFGWSVFTVLQAGIGIIGGIASAVAGLFVLRFLVGMAEAPAFPANARVVASWFPTRERGTASAIFNSAQYFAAVVFTPLMAAVTHWYGWRRVYVLMGLLGMVLALAWLKSGRGPTQHAGVNRAELDYLREGGALVHMEEQRMQATDSDGNLRSRQLRQLLANRMLLGVNIGQFSINVLTYFFLTWFPVYLVTQRHMSILKAGFMVSLPALCGFFGGILGGILSDAMLKRGYSLTAARKTPIVAGMLLSMSMIPCNFIDTDWIIVGLMALSFFGKGFGALGWAVMADVAPKEAIGLAGSLFNSFGAVAGIVTPIAIGYILAATGSFNGALVFVGANALVTIFAYLVIVRKIERVELGGCQHA